VSRGFSYLIWLVEFENMRGYFESMKSVIFSPSETLSDEERRSPTGYPLRFAVISVAIAGVFYYVLEFLFLMDSRPEFSYMNAVAGLAGGIIAGLYFLAVLAAFIHIFVYLLGGRQGYGRTLSAVFYGTAVLPVASFISIGAFLTPLLIVVSGLVGLWAIRIEARGVQHFHGISSIRATLAVMPPYIVLNVMLILSWLITPF